MPLHAFVNGRLVDNSPDSLVLFDVALDTKITPEKPSSLQTSVATAETRRFRCALLPPNFLRLDDYVS